MYFIKIATYRSPGEEVTSLGNLTAFASKVLKVTRAENVYNGIMT
jgi:hypothetical protein